MSQANKLFKTLVLWICLLYVVFPWLLQFLIVGIIFFTTFQFQAIILLILLYHAAHFIFPYDYLWILFMNKEQCDNVTLLL